MSGTLRSSLAEFLGTFALVWLAAGAAAANAMVAGNPGPIAPALAYGLGLAMLTYAFRSADAHFNPALTIALAMTRRLDGTRAVFLVFFQLLGAGAAGIFLARTFEGTAASGACALTGIGFRTGTLIEAMTAFWVVFVYCKARLDRGGDMGFAALGAAAACAAMATGPVTGGAFNPARAFGPAAALGLWDHWYVYWAGPLVGAAAAAALHQHLFADKDKEAA